MSSELRWDESRSVLELVDRLKNVTTLDLNGQEIAKENLHRILTIAGKRPEHYSDFALALGMLQSLAETEKTPTLLKEVYQQLGTGVALWDELETCAKITDSLAIKYAPGWLQVIFDAKGSVFLTKLIMKLPYRLWPYVETIYKNNELTNEFVAAIQTELLSSHVTPDILWWIWQNGESQKELKNKYLANAELLFRTLQKENKGNYLKAQKDLKKQLFENEKFQNMLMKNGDEKAVVDLIRCVKTMPLLDPGERQKMLVNIVEMYPQYKEKVEERRKGPAKIRIEKTTSIRGYRKREADLDNLIHIEIPANAKAIEHARSLGDLSENSEFKYAKERQAQLGKFRRAWEESLIGLRQTDFSDVKITNMVLLGCTVTVTYLNEDGTNGKSESFHIMGLLDSEPEKNIISYNAPLGQVLIGKTVGEKVTMPDKSLAVISSVSSFSEELTKYARGE